MGQSRIEDILENILGADNDIGEPQSRNEYLLIEIMGLIAEVPQTEITDSEITTIVSSID